jgi:hypothetical protein
MGRFRPGSPLALTRKENHMSFLNKVENVYLTILRLVVIAGATLALIAAIIFGSSAAGKLLRAEPQNTNPVIVTPENSPKLDVFTALKNPAVQNPKEEGKSRKLESEIKNPDMDAVVKNISQYIRDVYQFVPEAGKLRDFVTKKASELPEQTQNAYFKSLNEFSAELVKKIAPQKAIVAAAQPVGQKPADVPGFIDVDEAIDWHFAQFSKIVDKRNADMEQKQKEYVLAKAAGAQSLYIAAGSFATFLLIIFLFIIIKIERNLRGISVVKEN